MIKDILSKKWKYHNWYGFSDYFKIRTEFIDLVFENDEFSNAVRKVLLKPLADLNWFSDVFNTYCLYHLDARDESLKMPKFWNEEVEDGTKLKNKLLNLATSEKEKLNKGMIDIDKFEKEFKKSDWENKLMREDLGKLRKFVNDILMEMTLEDEKNKLHKLSLKKTNIQPSKQNTFKQFELDLEKSCLYISNKPIHIKKYSDTYHIVKSIFEIGLVSEIFYSEIAEKMDKNKVFSDKQIYNAIYNLNQRLQNLGFKEIFVTSKQSVVVNKEYL